MDVSTVNRRVGLVLSASEMACLLRKMQLEVAEIKKIMSQDGLAKFSLNVMVPPTRSDVIDPCDVAEDVAIAFGYGNIPPSIPYAYTVARQFGLNKFADKVRSLVAQSGYIEVGFFLRENSFIFDNLNIFSLLLIVLTIFNNIFSFFVIINKK